MSQPIVTELYEVAKLISEGFLVVGSCVALLVSLGIHKRKHQELEVLATEHKIRGESCPQVEGVSDEVRAITLKLDVVDSKVDRIVGYIEAQATGKLFTL
jgi:hypothetical protein